MQLHKILYVAVFVLWITGVAMMDSERVLLPVSMVVAGMALLIWAAREDGRIRKKGDSRDVHDI